MEYQKGEAKLEIGDARTKHIPATVSETSSIVMPLPGYTKEDGRTLPKSFLVIFSGGMRREEDYFSVIENNPDKFLSLKLKFYVEDRYKKHHEPLLFELALNKVDEYNGSSDPETPDDFFLLTDVDLFMPHIMAYKQRFEQKGINLIVNNPCLEVWLYYSKRNDRFVGFVPPANPDALSDSVKQFVHVQTGGVHPKKAIFDIKANIANARANYLEDENGIPNVFSTNMFLLAERMLPIIEDGLLVVMAERNKRAEMARRGNTDCS